jgi:methylmalonyl-CoA mutase N-terminal domain/subunit
MKIDEFAPRLSFFWAIEWIILWKLLRCAPEEWSGLLKQFNPQDENH